MHAVGDLGLTAQRIYQLGELQIEKRYKRALHGFAYGPTLRIRRNEPCGRSGNHTAAMGECKHVDPILL
jgi:hypothetical protein